MRLRACWFLTLGILFVALCGRAPLALATAERADADAALPSAPALAAGLAAFKQHRAQVRDRRRWTLIDFERPFTAVRLWVLDARREHAVLHASRVSHAWKSGVLYATEFSNEQGSLMSSLGSYVTDARTYEGRFGHSLRVRGLDRGVNDHAYARAIIFHPDLGMSHSAGCFMLPESMVRPVIDTITGGTFVYAYRAAQR